jgi:hypothetical protein
MLTGQANGLSQRLRPPLFVGIALQESHDLIELRLHARDALELKIQCAPVLDGQVFELVKPALQRCNDLLSDDCFATTYG